MRRALVFACAVIGGAGLYAGYVFGGNVIGYFGFRAEFARVAAERKQGPVSELVESCTYCHGEHGRGRASFYPALAGQQAAYLEAQLAHFADGSRPAPAMAPLARSLTAAQRHSLADWFAAQTPPPLAGAADAALAGCTSCHGEKLQGAATPVLAPRIAGLGRAYVANQLRNFRSGQRTAPDGGMNAVARPMDDGMIAQVSAALERMDAGNAGGG